MRFEDMQYVAVSGQPTASLPSAALLMETLHLLLGDSADNAEWQAWAEGASTTAPPSLIEYTQLDFRELGQLHGRHYPALQALQRRQVSLKVLGRSCSQLWKDYQPMLQVQKVSCKYMHACKHMCNASHC